RAVLGAHPEHELAAGELRLLDLDHHVLLGLLGLLVDQLDVGAPEHAELAELASARAHAALAEPLAAPDAGGVEHDHVAGCHVAARPDAPHAHARPLLDVVVHHGLAPVRAHLDAVGAHLGVDPTLAA